MFFYNLILDLAAKLPQEERGPLSIRQIGQLEDRVDSKTEWMILERARYCRIVRKGPSRRRLQVQTMATVTASTTSAPRGLEEGNQAQPLLPGRTAGEREETRPLCLLRGPRLFDLTRLFDPLFPTPATYGRVINPMKKSFYVILRWK